MFNIRGYRFTSRTTPQLFGAFAMDGQNRRRAVIKSLALGIITYGSYVIAGDPENAKHRDVKMYMSPTLETKISWCCRCRPSIRGADRAASEMQVEVFVSFRHFGKRTEVKNRFDHTKRVDRGHPVDGSRCF